MRRDRLTKLRVQGKVKGCGDRGRANVYIKALTRYNGCQGQ